jgi:uridine phosphorylase
MINPIITPSAFLTDNNILLCGYFGIGSPAATDLLEQLVAAGIKKVIAFGTAGVLHDEFIPGQLILCSEAFPDEGTSRHYIPDPGPAKPSGVL